MASVLASTSKGIPPLREVRLLLLASSHGAGMKETLETMYSNIKVYSAYQRGGKICDIYRMVEERITAIRRHHPTEIIVHIGHNLVAFHKRLNLSPENDFVVTDEVLLLVKWLQSYFPGLPIFYSTMFPRVPYKDFNTDLCSGYNRMVVRQARYARKIGLDTIVSDGLFETYRPPKANVQCYSERDGLHLSPYGQRIVAAAWMQHLTLNALRSTRATCQVYSYFVYNFSCLFY